MGHEQEGAKAPGLVEEGLDLLGRLVWRADDREAGLQHRLDGIAAGVDRRHRQVGDLPEVVEPLLQAEAHVGDGLVLGRGDVHRSDQAPGGAVHGLAVLLGQVLGDRPVGSQRVEPAGRRRPQRQQADPVATGRPRPGRRDLAGHRHLDVRPRIGRHLQPGAVEREPVRLVGHRLTAQQPQDDAQRLVHHVPLAGGRDAHGEGVRDQGARADPEHRPPTGHVVELIDPVGQHERVVIGQGRHPSAEPDVLGALGGGGDEHLGAGDHLVAGRMVLADPGLLVGELVQPLHKLEVALDGQGRVLVDRVEGRDESPETEFAVHDGDPPG